MSNLLEMDNKALRADLKNLVKKVSDEFIATNSKKAFLKKYDNYLNYGINFRKGSKNYQKATQQLNEIKDEMNKIINSNSTSINMKGIEQILKNKEISPNIFAYDTKTQISNKPLLTHYSEKYNQNFPYTRNETDMATVRNMLKNYKGKNVTAKFYVDGKEIQSVDYGIVPSHGFTNWYNNEHFFDWATSSYTNVFEVYKNYNNSSLNFYINDEIKKSGLKNVQSFLDGVKHCMFSPIKDWAIIKFNEAKGKSTKERYITELNKLEELEKKYCDGVPQDKIKEVCNILQLDINIIFPFQRDSFISEKSSVKRLRTFNFINTRLNHLEIDEINNIDETINVDFAEINNIYDYCIENKIYCQKRKNLDNQIIEVLANHKKYIVKDEYSEIVYNFKNEYGFNDFKISYIHQYDLSIFIRNGVHYNCTVDFKEKKSSYNIRHIDMQKAYSKFKLCTFYEGFLGKITDFRKCNKIMSVGLYKIVNLDFSQANEKFLFYNEKMNVYKNDMIYPSPELNFLSSMNVKYEIIEGCYGVEPFDFEFNDDMLNKKLPSYTYNKEQKKYILDEEKISYYAKFCGACDSLQLTDNFFMSGNRQYFEEMREYADENTKIYFIEELQEAKITYQKSEVKHLSHITAFITSYQRLNAFEQLMHMDNNKIIRICVDGIYYQEHEINLYNCFRFKEDKLNFKNEPGESYISTRNDYYYCEGEQQENYKIELYQGCGGGGKSYEVLKNNKGLINVGYFANSWKLSRSAEKNYMCRVDVHQKLISSDPERINFIKKMYNVLFIDECSMLNDYQRKYIIEIYNNMKIIFGGDHLQLPPIGEIIKENGKKIKLPVIEFDWNSKNFNNVREFTDNKRAKDQELKDFLINFRELLEVNKNLITSMEYVLNYFTKIGQIINDKDLEKQYNINDMILCGRIENVNKYTEMFKNKFENKNKYRITSNRHINYNNGMIEIFNNDEIPQGLDCEVQHAFTIHSIQGESIDIREAKLYLHIKDFFGDGRMFYTAVSRARYIDQIIIIT